MRDSIPHDTCQQDTRCALITLRPTDCAVLIDHHALNLKLKLGFVQSNVREKVQQRKLEIALVKM